MRKLIILSLLSLILALCQSTYIFSSKKKDNWNKIARPLLFRVRLLLERLQITLTKSSIESQFILPPTKSSTSLLRKLKNEKGMDLEKIRDYVRGSLVLSNIDEIYIALNLISRQSDFKIVKIVDRFGGPEVYQDIKINLIDILSKPFINDQGHKRYLQFELQLHLCQVIRVKEIEQYIYNIYRINYRAKQVHRYDKKQVTMSLVFFNILFARKKGPMKSQIKALQYLISTRFERRHDGRKRAVLDVIIKRICQGIRNAIYKNAFASYYSQKKCVIKVSNYGLFRLQKVRKEHSISYNLYFMKSAFSCFVTRILFPLFSFFVTASFKCY